MGLILALDRRIPDNVAELRAGTWNKKEYSKAQGLHGPARSACSASATSARKWPSARARSACRCVVWSRRFSDDAEAARERPQDAFGIEVVDSPAELVAAADVVSVHLALTKDTRGFVERGAARRTPKPGAYFINTARAEVVDYAALADGGARARACASASTCSPTSRRAPTGDFADDARALPGVYGTHHIGASTDQAQEAIAAETVRIVRTYKDTGQVPNVVNLATQTPATHMLVVRHRDKPGVLAHVFDYLRVAHLNVQETENIIFDGAQAAVARINLDGAPAAARARRHARGNADILDVQLVDSVTRRPCSPPPVRRVP